MADIRISDKLSEKLGKDSREQINFLVDFEKIMQEKLSIDNCPEEMRSNIARKMQNLTDMVTKIYKITKQHISNDKKKEKILELLQATDIKRFLSELNVEIELTKKMLLQKDKVAVKSMQEEAQDVITSFENFIKGNQNIVRERIVEARHEEATLRRGGYIDEKITNIELGEELEEFLDSLDEEESQEEVTTSKPKLELNQTKTPYSWDDNDMTLMHGTESVFPDVKKSPRAEEPEKSTDDEERKNLDAKIKEAKDEYNKLEAEKETSLVEYREKGFWSTFRRLRQEGKENPDKKIGIFAALKKAYEMRQDNIQTNLKDRTNERLDEIYQKQCEVADKLKRYNEEYRKFEEQLKVVRKEGTRAAENAMNSGRVAYDDATKTISEITAQKIGNVAKKVADFAKNNRVTNWAKDVTVELSEFVIDEAQRAGEKIDQIRDDILDKRIETAIDKVDKYSEKTITAIEKEDILEQGTKDREGEYLKAIETDENLSASAHFEQKVGKKIIRGINKAQYDIASVRYWINKRNIERFSNKAIRQDKKAKKYEQIREERRRTRNMEGMDR